MEFRVLGPLEVLTGSRRLVIGPQHQKALAMLLMADGNVVPLERLIDVLWDGEPPPSARHQVHKVIAILRSRLPGMIITDGPGYRMCIGNGSLDAATFARRAASGTIADLTAALGLWRGPALAGLNSRTLRTLAAGLDDRRLAAIESLMELRLASGNAAGVAIDLPDVIAAYPFRERLRAQLMVALYRSGRQADAFAAYADARTVLAEQLGVDPGAELVRVHGQMLRGELSAEVRVPNTLPYDLPDFTGRHADLELLLRHIESAPLHTIDGMAGVGKTALAVHTAHLVGDRFPDGQLFCDLHAHTESAIPVDASSALFDLLLMLGVPSQAIPEGLHQRAAKWRAELAGRRVLLVLDNAASAAQVRPLLPGTPGCLVLITSRRRLGMLDGAQAISLDVLPPPEAFELLDAVAGAGRLAAEHAAAREVVELCGHLPLAIRIAATRLAHRRAWSVESLAARLRVETARLDELAVEDRGVGSAFALSYAHLDARQQRMFQTLGLHPGGSFDAYSVAALADCRPEVAETLLEDLVDAHLVRHTPLGWYGMHDLIRSYARHLGAAEGDAPTQRLHDYYLATAVAANDTISREARRFEPVIKQPPATCPQFADVDEALAWLTRERATLMAVAGTGDGWQLACVLRAFFEHRGHYADWRLTHEQALSRIGDDRRGRTLLHFNLAALAMWTERLDESMDHLRRALEANDGDHELEATTLTNMGMLAHLKFRDLEAIGHLQRALAITHHNVRTKAVAWNNLGLAEGRLGRLPQAIDHHRRGLALARASRNPTALCGILLGLGETALRHGLPATEPFREAATVARAGRFRIQEALALDGLAHATGDGRYWREALVIFDELGVDRAGLVRRHLAEPTAVLCDLCEAQPARAASPVRAARSA